jgi:hypothetical protein
MIGYVKTSGPDDKKPRAYHCSVCGVFITDSGAALHVNGADRHSFVNPAGIRCNFLTFAACENAVEHPDLYEEHSWFPGYGWRFLSCGTCFHHLGWKYDALAGRTDPTSFFGVLLDSIEPVEQTD